MDKEGTAPDPLAVMDEMIAALGDPEPFSLEDLAQELAEADERGEPWALDPRRPHQIGGSIATMTGSGVSATQAAQELHTTISALSDAEPWEERVREIVVGREFHHARYLDENRNPEACRITKIKDCDVYYRVGINEGAGALRWSSYEYFLTSALLSWDDTR